MKQNRHSATQERFLRVNEVAEMIGVSKSSVWGYAKRLDDFPKPFKIGGNVTVWRLSEVAEWMERQAEKAS